MAVVSFCHEQRAPSASVRRGKFNSYVIRLTVTVDDEADDGGVVTNYLENNGYAKWTAYSQPNFSDPASIVTGITASRRAGSQFIWDAVVSYEGIEPKDNAEDDQGNQTEDPFEFRYAISVSAVPQQTPVWSAWNVDEFPRGGTPTCNYIRAANTLGPIVNSAGTVFDPPIMKDDYDLVYRFTGNYQFYDYNFLDPFVGRTNQFEMKFSDKLIGWYGMAGGETFPPNTVLMSACDAAYKRTNGIDYWEYTYEFRVRLLNNHNAYAPVSKPNGWYVSLLDQGVQRYAWEGCDDANGGTYAAGDLQAGRGTTVPILGLDGRRIPEKMNLDGRGQPLVPPSPTLPAPEEGYWFEWRVYEQKSMVTPNLALDIFQSSP